MIEKVFNTGFVNLNYAEGGNPSKPPLLLLHAATSRWQSFQSIIPELEENWHLYAVDLRGHGKSDHVNSDYKIEEYVPDISAFIEDCIKEPTIVFGHSLGGMISILVAAYHPALVKALIIGDSPISLEVLKEGNKDDNREMLILQRDLAKTKSVEYILSELKQKFLIPIPNQKDMVLASRVLGEDNPLFNFIATSLSQNDPEVLTAVLERFDETYTEYKIDELLPKIQCPVLLLQSDPIFGGAIRDEDAEQALHLLPKVTHIKINNVGHALHIQNKESVISAMLPFMTSL
ncbi:alpha/beta hydrolase [Bacillus sp. Xin]|uniref:alpha/beta fold hydrolase n=1 Tax=unclassified Bacillus (in: firmicutes) TaxID=185979 RepID=UPI0015717459|nr:MULTISPECIES: alpha/beta hydrolase [unclassified Bacillus (in: firmicutes)]MBC6975163.1 alpha/beta hydrolase [Bacillus sp. Xin]NSW39207.1 alpha/beta hydrolase [Bacillus sp. Xin1]